MFWAWWISLVWGPICWLVNCLVQFFLVVTLLFSISYRMGWFHRLVWALMEHLACHAANGTRVTIGSFDMDLLRGRLTVHNVIVHAPKRHVYKWESPVLARVGHIQAEFNPIQCLFAFFVLGEAPPALDVNLLYLSDIQCFVERRGQVFNVYLLDRFYVTPPHPHGTADGESLMNSSEPVLIIENNEPDLQAIHSSFGEYDSSDYQVADGSSNAPASERAELVVGEMLKAVQSLGRAVQEGQLPQALQEQRQRIAASLKQFQVNKQVIADSISLVQQVSGLMVTKTQQAVSQSNLMLLPLPNRQPPSPPEKPIMARFGRVILDDLRVFTRTTIAVEDQLQPPTLSSTQNLGAKISSPTVDEEEGVEVPRPVSPHLNESHDDSSGSKTPQQRHRVDSAAGGSSTTPSSWVDPSEESSSLAVGRSLGKGGANTKANKTSFTRAGHQTPKNGKTPTAATPNSTTSTTTYKSYWNKPITVQRIVVRPSEFGAPLTAKDENGFPVLYQPLDSAVDAIFKRVVGDMAKCNTGRLVRTAMGEVLDFYMEKEWQEKN